MEQVTVAFMGLGLMGRPMALHLRKKGHPLRVFSRTASKAEGFEAAGAVVCGNPAEAAKGARIIFVCVGDNADVEQVVLGTGGIVGGADRGALIVDHSTISPAVAQSIAGACRDQGLRFVDAPISGGEVGAIEGRLAIMCGGAQKDFDEAKDVMAAYGKKITRVGASGMGQVAKACNQILVVTTILGVAEAVTLARGLGADAEKVMDAVAGGAAESWTLNNLGPKMMKGDDSAGFYVKHQVKDLRIVLDTAREANVPLPGTALVRELYKAVLSRGGELLGNHTLYRALEVLAGKNWQGPAQKE